MKTFTAKTSASYYPNDPRAWLVNSVALTYKYLSARSHAAREEKKSVYAVFTLFAKWQERKRAAPTTPRRKGAYNTRDEYLIVEDAISRDIYIHSPGIVRATLKERCIARLHFSPSLYMRERNLARIRDIVLGYDKRRAQGHVSLFFLAVRERRRCDQCGLEPLSDAFLFFSRRVWM